MREDVKPFSLGNGFRRDAENGNRDIALPSQDPMGKAEANHVQYIENADGFLLLEDAKTALTTISGTLQLETGARVLDMLTKAVQRLPDNCPHLHAEAYQATAEILETFGDKTRAIEYYECALVKNPKIGVKRRLDKLKNFRSPDEDENLIQQCMGAP